MVFQKSRRKRELEICFNLIRNKVHFRGISECRKNHGFTNFIMTHLKLFIQKYNNLLKPGFQAHCDSLVYSGVSQNCTTVA